VNDRGPRKSSRILDLSYAAAKRLGMIRAGVIKVRVEVLDWGEGISASRNAGFHGDAGEFASDARAGIPR
jgi:rare lipoprotein A